MKKSFLSSLLVCCFFASALFSASLNIDTNYRLRGISYTNNDFDTTTSTDSISYYSQRLEISLIGKFDQGIEIGSKITAQGVVGSSRTIFDHPYPRADLIPYVENAYLKINNFLALPVYISIGKQPLNYGDGLIIADNGVGYDALRIAGNYKIPIPVVKTHLSLETDIFTAKIKENFMPDSDHTLFGGTGSMIYKEQLVEFGYFEDRDFSGTKYCQGSTEYDTRSIIKKYLDIRMGRKEKISSFQLEIAKQTGSIKSTNNGEIKLDGLAYVASGELIGEKTKLGKVNAHSSLSIFTGDDNPAEFDDDESFSPSFTRQFDGLERKGQGELFSATPNSSYFSIPQQYSGINTLSLGASFEPLYSWALGIDYFLFSASQGPQGAPVASGFERLFGAEYTLGIELQISVKYTQSKYIETGFTYSRYTPPVFEVYWPKKEPATRYQFEVSAKF